MSCNYNLEVTQANAAIFRQHEERRTAAEERTLCIYALASATVLGKARAFVDVCKQYSRDQCETNLCQQQHSPTQESPDAVSSKPGLHKHSKKPSVFRQRPLLQRRPVTHSSRSAENRGRCILLLSTILITKFLLVTHQHRTRHRATAHSHGRSDIGNLQSNSRSDREDRLVRSHDTRRCLQ